MRPKIILASEYFFLTDYQGIDAEETSELRKNLLKEVQNFML